MYKDIAPLDTLGDIKKRFPSAKFERRHPAWAQEDDVMYQITGAGLSGAIVVKFTDSRPFFRKSAGEATSEEMKKYWSDLANADDDTVDIEWVRWIPPEAIPLQRFVLKYGPPDVKGFDDDDLQPYRNWTSQGLSAFLSDDEKTVVRVDYTFTDAEHCAAWIARTGGIPTYFKDRCAAVNRLTIRPPKNGSKNH